MKWPTPIGQSTIDLCMSTGIEQEETPFENKSGQLTVSHSHFCRMLISAKKYKIIHPN